MITSDRQLPVRLANVAAACTGAGLVALLYGLIALTVASVSVSVSGFAFIGGPGFIYAVGLGAMYIVLPASVTNVLGAWVLAKRMRLLGEVRGLMTVPDAIGARYRSPAAQGLAGHEAFEAANGHRLAGLAPEADTLALALLGTDTTGDARQGVVVEEGIRRGRHVASAQVVEDPPSAAWVTRIVWDPDRGTAVGRAGRGAGGLRRR